MHKTWPRGFTSKLLDTNAVPIRTKVGVLQNNHDMEYHALKYSLDLGWQTRKGVPVSFNEMSWLTCVRSHFLYTFKLYVHMIYTHKIVWKDRQQTEQQLLWEIGKGRTILTRDVLFEFIMRRLYNIWTFVKTSSKYSIALSSEKRLWCWG